MMGISLCSFLAIMLQFTRQNTGDIIDSFQTSAVFSAQEPKRISLSLRPKTETKKDYCFTKVSLNCANCEFQNIFHIRGALKLQLTFLTSSTQMWILAMISTSLHAETSLRTQSSRMIDQDHQCFQFWVTN